MPLSPRPLEPRAELNTPSCRGSSTPDHASVVASTGAVSSRVLVEDGAAAGGVAVVHSPAAATQRRRRWSCGRRTSVCCFSASHEHILCVLEMCCRHVLGPRARWNHCGACSTRERDEHDPVIERCCGVIECVLPRSKSFFARSNAHYSHSQRHPAPWTRTRPKRDVDATHIQRSAEWR